jgi:hypothetical protein
MSEYSLLSSFDSSPIPLVHLSRGSSESSCEELGEHRIEISPLEFETSSLPALDAEYLHQKQGTGVELLMGKAVVFSRLFLVFICDLSIGLFLPFFFRRIASCGTGNDMNMKCITSSSKWYF